MHLEHNFMKSQQDTLHCIFGMQNMLSWKVKS